MPLLYKYRAFSSSEDKKRLFEILKTERFWFARANEVNDPFEFRCAVDFGWSAEKTEKAFVAIERLQNRSISEAEALVKVRQVLARVPPAKLRERQWELSYSIWRGFAGLVTLSCFAGTPTSVLMWSHYGGGHTGLAVEVEPIGLEECTFPVTYSDELPPITPDALVDAAVAEQRSLFDVLFLRKAKCWEYEREYRIMRVAPASHASPFKRGSIKRVILGCAMPSEAKQQLMEWLQANAPNIGVAAALPAGERTHSLEVVNVSEIES